MRTEDELVLSLHARMAARRREKERRRDDALRALCAGLALCLVALVFGAAHTGGTAGVYTGASMFDESAGGYVMVALIVFILGVGVTLLCLRLKDRSAKRTTEEKESHVDETGGQEDEG